MTETDAFHSSKTRKLQLQALTPSSIPSHPHFASQQSSNSASLPALVPFINEILNEGIAFADNIIPQQFSAKNNLRDSPPSAAKVKLLSSDVLQSANGKPEAWFARQSLHDDAAAQGTGTYQEFENGLMHDHSIHEKEYTPDVMDAHKVADWASELLSVETQSQLRSEGFEDVALEVYEMVHKIPAPLNNRVFSVIIARARTPKSTAPEPSFVVVQIPIQLDGVERAKYALDASGKAKQKVVQGAYCAVERVKRTSEGKVNWEMATASDAKGVLPMAVQKLGVPAAVIKDVGLFIKWTLERRTAASKEPQKTATPGQGKGSVGPGIGTGGSGEDTQEGVEAS